MMRSVNILVVGTSVVAALAGCGGGSAAEDRGRDAASANDMMTRSDVTDSTPDVEEHCSWAQLSVGYTHNCAVDSDHTAWCWGDNSYGAIGDGTDTDRGSPVEVDGLMGRVKYVSAGFNYTCALLDDGSVSCWGWNRDGQLGIGSSTKDQLTAQSVTLLGKDVTALWAGFFHTCARKADGALWCWGSGWAGQIGDGAKMSRRVPTRVTVFPTATKLALGAAHTCGLKPDDGSVSCWGSDIWGQLGDGAANSSGATPVAVVGLDSSVTDTASGPFQSCAVKTDHSLWCWGDNDNANLGDGTTTGHTVPIKIDKLGETVAEVSLYYDHSCSVGTDGSAYCWGFNLWGQIGAGESGTLAPFLTPTAVTLPGAATSIGAGRDHTCVMLKSGAILCWGSNGAGQIAHRVFAQASPVIPTGFMKGAIGVGAGWRHTCAVRDTGAVFCWGDNESGELGDGSWTTRTEPVMTGLTGAATAIAAGLFHNCARRDDGSLWCWGDNFGGQLGDGSYDAAAKPVRVALVGTMVASVSAGGRYTCAVLVDGSLYCWGLNNSGQLGDGTMNDHVKANQVASLGTNVAAVATGYEHACALAKDGGVWCWGDATYGQLGDGRGKPNPKPMEMPTLGKDNAAIAAGAYHACSRKTDGSLWCWGNNYYGAIGRVGSFETAPGPVVLPASAVDVSGGWAHTCAALSDGTVACWGLNADARIDGGDEGPRDAATIVKAAGTDVVAVGLGATHTCARKRDGGLICWGRDGHGQLGDGAGGPDPRPGTISKCP